jgi:hypothetical protein
LAGRETAIVAPPAPLDRGGRRHDRAALVLELLVEDADVARPGREAGGLECLHVIHVDQQQREHHQAGKGEPEQSAVHRPLTAPGPAS